MRRNGRPVKDFRRGWAAAGKRTRLAEVGMPEQIAMAYTGKREVDKGIKSSDIQSVIEAETRLPSTYRRGLGHGTDDIATGADGQPTKVWGPDNPEDSYK